MVEERKHKSQSIFNAWKRYVDDGLDVSESVSPTIMDSWMRCRKMGLDPYKSKIKIEKADVLEKKRESTRAFIDIITPYVNGLKANAQDMDILVGLFDSGGKLVYIDGDRRVSEAILALGIRDGADFSEESAGTNGIAIAIKQSVPVAVLGYEHFCRDFHIFNTASTPIFNKEGKVEVILGIIALRMASSEAHLMTILTGTAFFVEREMRLGRVWPRLTAYSNLMKEIFEESKDAVFVMTRHGYIKQVSPAALKMLDVDNYMQLSEPLENLVKIKPSLLKLLEKGEKTQREIPVSISTSAHAFEAVVCLEPLLSPKNEPIGMIVKLRKVSGKWRSVKKAPQAKYRFADIIGKSPSMQKAVAIAKKAAQTSMNVLVEGESGTGKEMFAQAIHSASERAEEPFIAVNCASIPKDLIESELFGYDAGAFTGARKEGAAGKFEAANGGTILLDEIGDMPFELQSRLLRVLETRTITRIGSNKEISIDIRVIADTSKKLIDMVEKKQFRDDLYYRLSVAQIKIPPLRERPEDILLLLSFFISHFNETMGVKIEGIHPALMKRVFLYDWPGNVREVRNMIEHAVGVKKEGLISWQHLSDDLREALLYTSPRMDTKVIEESLLSKKKKMVLNSEREMYASAIEIAGGNMSRTASILKVSRATLYRKLKQLEVKR